MFRLRLVITLALFVIVGFTASAQPGLVVGQSVTGTITGAPEATETYRVTAQADDILLFELTSTLPKTQLELYDADGYLLNIGVSDTNNLTSLVFIVDEAGDYLLKVAYYGAGSGTYQLSLSQVPVQTLPPGQPVTVQIAGQPLYFTFAGRADQLVSLTADSGGQLAARLEVLDPDGYQIAYASASDGADPALPRLLLRAAGEHTLLLYPPANSAPGTLTVLLQDITPLSLDTGPQTVTLGHALPTEVFQATVERGVSYRLELTVLSGSTADLMVLLFQGDALFARLNATAEAMQTISLQFSPLSVNGLSLLTVQDYNLSDDTRLQVQLIRLPGG